MGKVGNFQLFLFQGSAKSRYGYYVNWISVQYPLSLCFVKDEIQLGKALRRTRFLPRNFGVQFSLAAPV